MTMALVFLAFAVRWLAQYQLWIASMSFWKLDIKSVSQMTGLPGWCHQHRVPGHCFGEIRETQVVSIDTKEKRTQNRPLGNSWDVVSIDKKEKRTQHRPLGNSWDDRASLNAHLWTCVLVLGVALVQGVRPFSVKISGLVCVVSHFILVSTKTARYSVIIWPSLWFTVGQHWPLTIDPIGNTDKKSQRNARGFVY